MLVSLLLLRKLYGKIEVRFMRLYDLILVLKGSLSEAERKKLLDSVRDKLKEAKVKDEEWGQKPLAYKTKRELAGYYHITKIEIENAIDPDIEKRLQANENVRRHLLLRRK